MSVSGLRRQLVTAHRGAELCFLFCAVGCARTKAEVLWEWKPWMVRWVILHCVLNQWLTSCVLHMKRNEFARMLFPQWRLVSEQLWPAGPGMVYRSVVSRQVMAFRVITFLLLSFLSSWLKHRWHISELTCRSPACHPGSNHHRSEPCWAPPFLYKQCLWPPFQFKWWNWCNLGDFFLFFRIPKLSVGAQVAHGDPMPYWDTYWCVALILAVPNLF